MKKAQMLQFLFYTILALVIFIPTILFASQFFSVGDKSLPSFNQLSSTIESIKDGELKSFPLTMNPDNLITGFTKESIKVESVIYEVWPFDATSKFVSRPQQCEKGKSCLCMCKDDVESEGETIKCTGKIFCNSFNTINFFEKRPVGEIPFQHSKLSKKTEWRNGFFLTNSKNPTFLKKIYPVDTVTLISKIPKTLAVYVQRHKDLVNVCLSKECITNEMIDELNNEDAIKEFKRFKETYLSCKQIGKKCGAFSLKLPERYFITYETSISGDIFGQFYDEEGRVRLIISREPENIKVEDKEGNEFTFEATVYQDDEGKSEYQPGTLKFTEIKKIEDDGKVKMILK